MSPWESLFLYLLYILFFSFFSIQRLRRGVLRSKLEKQKNRKSKQPLFSLSSFFISSISFLTVIYISFSLFPLPNFFFSKPNWRKILEKKFPIRLSSCFDLCGVTSFWSFSSCLGRYWMVMELKPKERALYGSVVWAALAVVLLSSSLVFAGDIVHQDDIAPKRPGCDNNFVLVKLLNFFFFSFFVTFNSRFFCCFPCGWSCWLPSQTYILSNFCFFAEMAFLLIFLLGSGGWVGFCFNPINCDFILFKKNDFSLVLVSSLFHSYCGCDSCALNLVFFYGKIFVNSKRIFFPYFLIWSIYSYWPYFLQSKINKQRNWSFF